MTSHPLADADLAAVTRVTPDLAPVAFRIGARVTTYRFVASEGVVTEDGAADDAAVLVSMSEAAWADLTTQVRTLVNLHLADQLAYERGDFARLADWGPLLTLVHAGVPLYDPARVDLSGVDLGRSFTLDDSDEELRHYLGTTGYLHVRGVFADDEIAALNAEVDRLAGLAKRGDDESWWVTDEDGNDALCRLVYAGLRSDLMKATEFDSRVARLGTLLHDDLRPSHDRMEGAAILLKVPGKTQGLSNIPWHQDCGMGGHAIYCPSVGVGIQLTGSNADDRQHHLCARQPRSVAPQRMAATVRGRAGRGDRYRAGRCDGAYQGCDARVAAADRGRHGGAPCTSRISRRACGTTSALARRSTTWSATAPKK